MEQAGAASGVEQRVQMCVGCGYSLTGHQAPGACPECGKPFQGTELCIRGATGLTLFSTAGCLGALGALSIITAFLMMFDRMSPYASIGGMTVAMFFFACMVGLKYVQRDEVSGTSVNLLVLGDEIRFRQGGADFLTFPFESIERVTLKRRLEAWMLVFHVSSLAFTPKFRFRAGRQHAADLHALLEARIRAASER